MTSADNMTIDYDAIFRRTGEDFIISCEKNRIHVQSLQRKM